MKQFKEKKLLGKKIVYLTILTFTIDGQAYWNVTRTMLIRFSHGCNKN